MGKKNIKWGLVSLLVLCLMTQSSGLVKAANAPSDDEDDKLEVKKPDKGKEKSLTLSMGVSKILEFQFDIGPLFIGDSNLFDFQRIEEGGKVRKLRLIPKNSGYTDMTINDTDKKPRITYFVRVAREDMGQVISQLEELLGDIEGLKIKPVGGTVVLDGEILLPKDMVRVIRVTDALKDRDAKKKEVPIRNIASISKITMNIIAERIEREINSPEISVRVLNNNLIIEGTAEDDDYANRALNIAKTYLPEAFVEKNKGDGGEVRFKQEGGVGGLPGILDFMRVRPRQAQAPSQDIKITMNYVELNNEYEKNFNFEWRPLANDSSAVKYDSSLGELSASVVATVSSLFPKLVSAKNHGHARVLKQQTIIVKDKAEQPAAIDSSLQIYVTNINEKGERSLQPVVIQNATKVRASTIAGSDSLELGIQIQLSSPVGVQNGSPVIATNSLQTQITVKNGDSAALGGNAVDSALSGYNREPTTSARGGGAGGGGGGGTPIFNLQRSKSFVRNKNQYVIFVTPEILRTASSGTEDITRKFRLNAGER
jgi:pilus assembly protein CpaC